jgi:exonuclease VII large subunit
MNTSQDISPATPETFWANISIITERQAEADRIIKETAEQMKETDRRIEETRKRMEENAEQMKETDRRFEETRKRIEENAEQKKETDRLFRETRELIDKNGEQIKKLHETVGGWSNNHGSFAEEYFFNSFENGKQNFFGERFDEIEKNLKPKNLNLKDEYDIVMYNHSAVAIVEVKFKARERDIPKILNKAKTFRILCPDYKDYKIYLGFASLTFCPELELECIDHGIAVIKQVGDMVVINDSGLKVF